jgi:hypothetical protein
MRFDSMSDHELEAALRSLGDLVDWPEAPDVTDEIIRELRRRESRPVPLPRTGRRRNWGRGLLIAAALLVPVAGTAIAATLLWNLGGIRVEVIPPTTGPLPTDTVDPGSLGVRIALEDAPDEVGFVPIYPGSLGVPDEVYAPNAGDATYVALAWLPDEGLPRIPGTPWGALLFEVPGEDSSIAKDVFAGQVTPAVVDGREALWARGEHPLRIDADGADPEFLVTGNVLLWNEQEFAMRFESLLEQDEAIRIAEAIVP